MTELTDQNEYKELVAYISKAYSQGQQSAVRAINSSLLSTCWEIGRYIVEFEQGGAERAKYGLELLSRLSKDLSIMHGKGFSLSNIKRMRQFYLAYPIGATVSHQLDWSHYVELLKLEDGLERSFYLQQIINERWSIRELKRQINASLFLRLAATCQMYKILHYVPE